VSLDELRSVIGPLRQALLEHPIYHDMRSSEALRTFMEHHVFAVWDFMSLLKALQQRLCCVSVPWVPKAFCIGGRLVNEIVLAEETDDDGQGGYASHFDLYHRAMVAFGADTSKIDDFLEQVRGGRDFRQALHAAEIHESIQQLVGHTFAVIESGDLCRIAAAFTFGREDLLPEVFQKIVDELALQADGDLDRFNYYLLYYLLRHIELDGDEHGPMAARLVMTLCDQDDARWQAATEAAIEALEARLAFWDSIHRAVNTVQSSAR
jgi:hypothetical protein